VPYWYATWGLKPSFLMVLVPKRNGPYTISINWKNKLMALGLNVAQFASTNVHGDHEELNENHHHHHQSLIWIGLLHKGWFILTLKDCNFWEVVFMWLPPQI